MLANENKFPCYLIVDDSLLSLRWLARTLQSIGPCQIQEASDGVQAVEKLASAGDRIDAIISDLQMPNMNGLELLKEVRLGRTGGRQSAPFFIVTGFTERVLAGLALGLDVDAFLARPIKMQALKRHLVRTCAEPRAEKTEAEAHATYGEVDPTQNSLPDAILVSKQRPRTLDMPNAIHQGTSVDVLDVLDEALVALESVPEGAILSRDAVNGAGTVLLKAGEEMTPGLKAVLMSYAEVDGSVSKIWVAGGP